MRAAKIDRLVDRLLKETIRIAETRAGVSLVALQGSELDASIQNKAIDWVLELSSLQVAFGGTASTHHGHVHPTDNAVMQELLLIKSKTYFYSKYFGSSLVNPMQSEWTETDEAYWAAIDQCPEILAQEIVAAVFHRN